MTTSLKYLQNIQRNIFGFKHVKHSRTKDVVEQEKKGKVMGAVRDSLF